MIRNKSSLGSTQNLAAGVDTSSTISVHSGDGLIFRTSRREDTGVSFVTIRTPVSRLVVSLVEVRTKVGEWTCHLSLYLK